MKPDDLGNVIWKARRPWRCPKIYHPSTHIDDTGTESYMRQKHRMEFYYTGSTCTCVFVFYRNDRTETPLYRMQQ